MGVDGGRRARAKRRMVLNPTPRATRHTINWTTWPLIGAAGTSGGVVGSYPAVRVRWSAHKNGCMVQVTPPPPMPLGTPFGKKTYAPLPPRRRWASHSEVRMMPPPLPSK